MQSKSRRSFTAAGAIMPLAVACIVGVVLAGPSAVYAQGRSRDRRDSGRSDSRDNGRSDSRDSGRGESRRGRDESRVRFTHSEEGRRFDNGVALRRGIPVPDRHFDTYFPHHFYSYPHYSLRREPGRVVVSPFSFYVGVFPPYIERSAVIIAAPRRVFIDIPIYVHGEYRVYADTRDDYYLNRRSDDNRWKDDPELRHTVYDLEDAFRNEDITLLASLTDPNADIGIFARGHYEYTLNPNDYLDMTRDFMRSAHTTGFTVNRVHRKAADVYQVFARHTYEDQSGVSRTVYVCVVLERIHDRWTITQIDTSPSHINS